MHVHLRITVLININTTNKRLHEEFLKDCRCSGASAAFEGIFKLFYL